MYLPCGVFSNQKCGNLRSSNTCSSSMYIILPLSTELRDNRSGNHAKIPLASPASMRSNILLNSLRPGFFAACFSMMTSTMYMPMRAANSFSSAICAAIDNTCLSSTSVLLRTYKKYTSGIFASSPFIVALLNSKSRLGATQFGKDQTVPRRLFEPKNIASSD